MHAKWMTAVLIIMLAVAFITRFYNVEGNTSFTGDEIMNVSAAYNYTELGDFAPDNWYHPPMKDIIFYPWLKVFGNNPFGWRIRNVIFGTLLVFVVYKMGTFLLRSRFTGLAAAALIMSDPLLIGQSRTAVEEFTATLLLTLAVMSAEKFRETSRTDYCLLTGLLFGVALPTRFYAVPVIAITLLLYGVSLFREKRHDDLVKLVCSLLLIPFCCYLLAYAPWFLRGNSFLEWLFMQQDALRELSKQTIENYSNQIPLERFVSGGPLYWFIRPISMGFGTVNAHTVWLTVLMNNLPVWIMVLPAIVFLFIRAVSARNVPMIMVPAVFCAIYLLYLVVKRPIFIYSCIPMLPFAFLAIGYAVEQIAGRWKYPVLLLAVSWSLYLYPLSAGITMPAKLYQPILNHLTLYLNQ